LYWPRQRRNHALHVTEDAMDDFETFARTKIAALRAEADQLERLLREFQAKRRQAAASGAGHSAAQAAVVEISVPTRPRRREGSAFGKIMEAVQAAGAEGMSIDDMLSVAAREGITVERNTLRSQIWHEKRKGRLVPLANGRYAAAEAVQQAGSSQPNLIPTSST
jgi:fructosamine-3-kinase